MPIPKKGSFPRIRRSQGNNLFSDFSVPKSHYFLATRVVAAWLIVISPLLKESTDQRKPSFRRYW
jgi:hypothetical protein